MRVWLDLSAGAASRTNHRIFIRR